MVDDLAVALKNDPLKNIELREEYTAVKPGYHLNKQHWNTVQIDGSLPDNLIKNLIDESYDSVVMGLTRKKQQEIKKL